MKVLHTRGRICVLACLSAVTASVVVSAFSSANADESQGTTLEQVKRENLPKPSSIRLAVLPLGATIPNVEAERVATLFSHQLFVREGFQVLGPRAGFEAVDGDAQAEAGQPLDRDRALRLGKSLGVDWVVWGEVRQAEEYIKAGTFGDSTRMRFALVLHVADVTHAKTIYSRAASVDVGTKGKLRSKSKAQRLLFAGSSHSAGLALQVLTAALPAHKRTPADLDEKSFFRLYDQIWPSQGQRR